MTYKTKSKRCLGIDPGLANCGWAVVHRSGQKYQLIEKGTIRTKSTEEQPYRLEKIYADVLELLREHTPDKVEIEAVFFNRNVKSCISTASVIAVVEIACRHCDIPSNQIKPQSLKSAVTGTGRATKEQVKYMIHKLLRTEIKSNHEADAAAAAIAGLQRANIPSG